MMSRILLLLTQRRDQSAAFFMRIRARMPIQGTVWPLGAIHPVPSFKAKTKIVVVLSVVAERAEWGPDLQTHGLTTYICTSSVRLL